MDQNVNVQSVLLHVNTCEHCEHMRTAAARQIACENPSRTDCVCECEAMSFSQFLYCADRMLRCNKVGALTSVALNESHSTFTIVPGHVQFQDT